MFLDFRRPAAPENFEFDICIIGAGPAGISLALALAGSGARVGLLESGGYDGEPGTQALYEGESVGFHHTGLDTCRLRFLGGSSNCWNGWCAPLEDIDFEQRDWVPHSGWPIALADLAPWYVGARTLCEVTPHGNSEALWEKLPFHREAFDGARVRTPFWQYSPPTRFGQRYRSRLTNAPGITVLLHTNAIAIETTEQADRATGIAIATLAGRRGHVSARFIVVACGGIENARLLLASNERVPSGLGNARDQVGRYFMEHPYAISGYVVSRHFDHLSTVEKKIDGAKLESVFCTGFETQRKFQVLNSMALVWPDEEVAHLFTWGRGALPDIPDGFSAYALMSQSEQSPNPASRIRLSDERDPFGRSRAKMDWRLLPIDKKTVRIQMEQLGAELARLDLGRLKLADWLLDGDALWGMGGGNHHMGTTRMGDDPASSVVDRNCKVHGLDNLYVAGSSVFATSGWANPTLTIVALSLRLADELKAKLPA